MAAKHKENIALETAVDMTDVDGSGDAFSLDVAELRELMEVRGHEAVEAIRERFDGVTSICSRLLTDEHNGRPLI